MLTSEELDHLDKSIHCLRLELPKAVADDALPPLHRLVQEHRESLSRRAADDGEAITEEWLRANGWVAGSAGIWRLGTNKVCPQGNGKLSLWSGDEPGNPDAIVKLTTRGQLRRLLEAIGGKP